MPAARSRARWYSATRTARQRQDVRGLGVRRAALCRAVPIPLSDRVTTTVRLAASGLRNAGPHANVRVTVGGVAVPVLSFGPADDVGRDQVTIQLPVELQGRRGDGPHDDGERRVVERGAHPLWSPVRHAARIAWLAAVAWGAPSAYQLALPKGFPKPRIPIDNPLTADKVRLGRYLFYDKRMSVNGTTSCATCHRQELAFTDGRARAVGATGQTHPRSSMSLVNVAYAGAFNWSNPTVHSLEEQALKPMFGTDPVELGVVREVCSG